jgi:hypothetical protein
MEKWKEEILEGFKQGKTIQSRFLSEDWKDFERQNQLDRPNLNLGTLENWRIKPDYKAEKEQILKDSGSDLNISDSLMGEIRKHEETVFKDYRETKCFTKEDMFLFAGLCVGYRQKNPSASAAEMFDIWCASFKSKR